MAVYCRVMMLPLFCIFGFLALSPLYAEDARPAEPEGTRTECEVLWREEVPRFLDKAPDGSLARMDEMRSADVAVARDGSVYLLCNIVSDSRLGPKIQTLLVKYDAEGEREWHRLLDENTSDIGHSIAVDPAGNVYFVGVSTRIDRGGTKRTWGIVASYNARGRERWTYIENGQSGTVPARYQSLVVHGDSVYAVGSANGRVGPGARFDDTPGDAMVTRLRLNGRKQWTRPYQGESANWRTHGVGIAAMPDGRVCITGVQEYVANAGDRNPAPSDSNCFVLCLDGEDGDPVWREVVEGGAVPAAHADQRLFSMGIDLATDSEGNLYLVGRNSMDRRAVPQDVRETLGTYVCKLTGRGEVLWSRHCPNASTSVWRGIRAARIRVDDAGRVWVAGTVAYGGTGNVGLLEYDSDGDLVNVLRYQSPGFDRDGCFGFAFDSGRYNLLVAGASEQLPGRGDLLGDDDGGRGRARPRGRPREQPVQREPRAPQYFVMRLPLLGEAAAGE
ncbi:SBBP repeat-containing protein [Phycisphaeraceae bacterium D3-23]